MKILTVRLPEAVVAHIEAESRRRQPALLEAIADLVGSVDGLPRDLSARTKKHLRSTG
jgi:hypothetical protein